MYHETVLPMLNMIWLYLVATGFCLAIYFSSLSASYQRGDMSLLYPLIRSSPLIVVMTVLFVFGEGDVISQYCIIGTVLIVVGCFILPIRDIKLIQPSNYLNSASFFALMAAFGTAGYSMIDDRAIDLLRNSEIISLEVWQITCLYIFFEGLSCVVWLFLFTLLSSIERANLKKIIREGVGPSICTGIGIYGTYILILFSMSYASNVSYVVAFRQVSVPIGTIMGVVILKESSYMAKYIGVVVIFVGLLSVGLG